MNQLEGLINARMKRLHCNKTEAVRQLARLINVTPRHLFNILNGTRKLSGPTEVLVNLLLRLENGEGIGIENEIYLDLKYATNVKNHTIRQD